MGRSARDYHDKIYTFLQECAGKRFPTVREIGDACGISSPSCVHKYLLQLEQEGLIHRENGRARSISVSTKQTALVPLVGRVAAGVPITAVELIEDYIPFDAATAYGECFALRVVGDSMKNGGILNGDIVICRQCDTAENGEIVVAMIAGEATVKRFFLEEDRVVLKPENPAFEPIVSRDAVILGKVIAVLRTYS